jgi:hypothetical protein
MLEKLCSKCCEIKTIDRFTFRRRVHKHCNECENRDYRHCKGCKLTKHINNFYRHNFNPAFCNSCASNSENLKNETMKMAFDLLDKIGNEQEYAI